MFRKIGFNLSKMKHELFLHVMKRHKSAKLKISKQSKHKTSKQLALDNFDDLYGNVFGDSWPSIRVALLSQSKYIALVNNFGDVDRVVRNLENLGAVDFRRLLECEAERISERKVDDRKKTRNNQESRTNRIMGNLAEKAYEDELGAIYPDGCDITTKSISASDGLSRLIDPNMSSGSTSLYEFVPATKLKGKEDWIPESDHYRYYNATDDLNANTESQNLLEYPSELKVYCFTSGCCDLFPKPKRSHLLGVTDYYLMDGGSLLPILALDLKPGDNFLDLCAAPGGKSLIAMQTLYPNLVTMNDSSLSRCNRIRHVMNEFILDFNDKLARGSARITNQDGRNLGETDIYNKVLVDVPCTTDRHSVMEDDNNIFKNGRFQERIKIPELQSALLASAFQIVKVGGTVVYSTCSLSPVQNDGVVHMALQKVHEQTNVRMSIVDMSRALESTGCIFKYHSDVVRCGHLVVPYLPDNYGPTYFCKFVRLQ